MNVSVNNTRINQYSSPASHIITDSAETVKLLEKKCGFVKPWSLENKPENQDKSKQVNTPKEYRKIDFYL